MLKSSVSNAPEARLEGQDLAIKKDDKLGEELNLRRKLLQSSVVKRISELREDGKSSAPWVVELDPTSACNLVCPDCISKDLLNQGGFTSQRLREIAEELVEAGVKAVIMIGGGEPLAHKETAWVMEYLSTHGVDVGVTTNGTLIDRHMDVLSQHTKWVRVSVDAGTPDTFQYFRPSPNGKSKFNEVIDNMREFARHKTGKLGYSFLLLSDFDHEGKRPPRTNFDEVVKAAHIAKDIGCDYFEIKPCYDFNHFLIDQPDQYLAIAREQIVLARELTDANFRVITPATLDFVLNNEPLVQPKDYNRCVISEMRTLITPSGAYVCPYFRGMPKKMIGDPTTQSFKEIWDSKKRHDVTAATDPSQDCRFHCIRHKSNMVIEEMLTGTDHETVDDYDMFI